LEGDYQATINRRGEFFIYGLVLFTLIRYGMVRQDEIRQAMSVNSNKITMTKDKHHKKSGFAGFTRFLYRVSKLSKDDLNFEYNGINQTCLYFANDFLMDLIIDPEWPVKSSRLDTFLNFMYSATYPFSKDARGAFFTLWIAYEINRKNFDNLRQPKWLIAERILQALNLEDTIYFLPRSRKVDGVEIRIEYFEWAKGYFQAEYPDEEWGEDYNPKDVFQNHMSWGGEIHRTGGKEIVLSYLEEANIDVDVFDLYFSSKSGMEIEYWKNWKDSQNKVKVLSSLLPNVDTISWQPFYKDIVAIFPTADRLNAIKFSIVKGLYDRDKTVSKSEVISLLEEMNYCPDKVSEIKKILGYKLPKSDDIISLSYRFDIFKRDNYSCQLCGKTAKDGIKLEIDHKIPKSKGGNNTPDNLWILCFDCNRGKSDKLLDD
jgi:hypothetical protein